MVEVRFACIPGVAGVKCTLDGTVKYSDETGICSFSGISQGAHSYSVEAPAGWKFEYGYDYFNRPLSESGTTVIEWVPYPEIPFPEDEPWMMKMVFEEITVGIPTTLTISAPATVNPEETFNIIGQLTRNDTGEALPNMSISISYNGKSIGSVQTDMQGVYTIPAAIPTTGTYTLKAEFLGTAEYAASKSTAYTRVTTPLEAAIKIAVPAVTGLALIIYSLS